MDEDYKKRLKMWAAHTAALVLVSVILALIQRWVGITVAAPPLPPITVVVESPDGKVTPVRVVTP